MPRDVDFFRACFDAVENCVAPPHAILGVDDVEPLVCGFIACIEGETVCFQQ